MKIRLSHDLMYYNHKWHNIQNTDSNKSENKDETFYKYMFEKDAKITFRNKNNKQRLENTSSKKIKANKIFNPKRIFTDLQNVLVTAKGKDKNYINCKRHETSCK